MLENAENYAVWEEPLNPLCAARFLSMLFASIDVYTYAHMNRNLMDFLEPNATARRKVNFLTPQILHSNIQFPNCLGGRFLNAGLSFS